MGPTDNSGVANDQSQIERLEKLVALALSRGGSGSGGTGPTGPAGASGVTGPTGPAGSGGSGGPIEFAVGTTTTSSATSSPAGPALLCYVNVTTAYSAGANLQIGNTGSPSAIATSGLVALQSIGVYPISPLSTWAAWGGGNVQATITGAPSTGAMTIVFQSAVSTA
jgi:hypothetical protein